MLNEYQRQRVSITIRSLEENLHAIEEFLKSENYSGVLLEIKNDIPPSVKDALIPMIAILKEKLGIIAEKFDLEKRTESISQQIFAMLSFDLVSIEEIKAKRLRGYGEAADELYRTLDPEVDLLKDLLQEMLDILSFKQK
jgi:hypothetical protein